MCFLSPPEAEKKDIHTFFGFGELNYKKGLKKRLALEPKLTKITIKLLSFWMEFAKLQNWIFSRLSISNKIDQYTSDNSSEKETILFLKTCLNLL